jgi:adenosylcobinamide kinase/adenosylcobinamide-phosphate guanylyltransferase
MTGGAASGKSELAEKMAVGLNKGTSAYIATMLPYDSEGRMRVDKHKKMRDGKGFDTHEIPYQLDTKVEMFKTYDTVLLECMSNLILNEMCVSQRTNFEILRIIPEGIEMLKQQVINLVIVSGTVFLDLKRYDQFTIDYVQTLSQINNRLAGIADVVIEVVCSIPIIHKGKKEILIHENLL